MLSCSFHWIRTTNLLSSITVNGKLIRILFDSIFLFLLSSTFILFHFSARWSRWKCAWWSKISLEPYAIIDCWWKRGVYNIMCSRRACRKSQIYLSIKWIFRHFFRLHRRELKNGELKSASLFSINEMFTIQRLINSFAQAHVVFLMINK